MKQHTIKVTILLENSLWIALFERTDNAGFAAARHIFGGEPTDPELYEFISTNYQLLKFTIPQSFKLIIKRKNPKRVLREVKREMERAKEGLAAASHAQEALRLEIEKNKKMKKTINKEEKQAQADAKFQQKQTKKKQKHRGH